MLKKIKLGAKNWVVNNRNKFFEHEVMNKKLIMCKKCYTFRYRNSWHIDRPTFLESGLEEEVAVRFTECPACLEEEETSYEMDSNLVMG